jgi:3-hydroxyacyl-[acyl-carrier-protein] dehydratase
MKNNLKFLNELYTIITFQEESDNKMTAVIEINRDHDVFKGHFPENPILPGVCSIQILKEILTLKSGKAVILSKASSVKYLSFINPHVNAFINFDIEIKETEDKHLICNASIYFESITFCRFKGEFVMI